MSNEIKKVENFHFDKELQSKINEALLEVSKTRKLNELEIKKETDLAKIAIGKELATTIFNWINTGNEIRKMNASTDNYWKQIKADIEKLNAETDVIIIKHGPAMEKEREKTKRIEMFVNLILIKGHELDIVLQEAIKIALENITKS